MARGKLPPIVSLIYTHNPFYLMSTCLFVYGLKLLFRSGDSAIMFQRGSVAYIEPWGLLGSFAAVTLLMALTAALVVRLGRVWEDARSLVLIVLLMLLAMAVSCDELFTLLSDRDLSRDSLYQTLAIGSLFALCVCEFLIRTLRIRFGFRLRGPLYAFLLLFFLWPALLLTEITGFTNEITRWYIVGFPSVAGLITLALIPAARRGAAAVASNGTPWGWPLFPWTPFFFIAIAACLRAWFLTMSFDMIQMEGHYWDTIFGVYQLVPFALCVLLLLQEIARKENATRLQNTLLVIAPLLLVPACPWLVPWANLPAYRGFFRTVTTSIASPVFLTVCGLLIFYTWAVVHRVRHAAAGLNVVLLLAGVLGPRAFAERAWQWDFTPWPWLVLAITQTFVGLTTRQSLSLAAGLMMGILTGHNMSWGLMATKSTHLWFVTCHMTLIMTLAIGATGRDLLARTLQDLGIAGVCFTLLTGTIHLTMQDCGPAIVVAYVTAMTLLTFSYGTLVGNRGYLWVAAGNCAIGAVSGVVSVLRMANQADLPAGTRHVILAVVSFTVAVFITMLKSGLNRRISMWWALRRRTARQR